MSLYGREFPLLFSGSLESAFAESVAPEGDPRTRELLASVVAAAREGHLCIPCSEFPMSCDAVVYDDGALYLRRLWQLQCEVVEGVKGLLQGKPQHPVDERLLESTHLLPEQLAAVRRVATSRLTLICGGPGTGKTFTIAHLITLFRQQHPGLEVILAAPTGKAARNLSKGVDGRLEAHTLHSLLGLRPGRKPGRAEPVAADLVVVDEASMIDVQLMALLLQSIRPGASLVLIGDPYQLPSVEAGSVFHDLCEALPHRVVALTRCLRAERAELVTLAERLRLGDCGFPLEPLNTLPLWDLYPGWTVLTPLQKGPFGVEVLNAKLLVHHKQNRGFPMEVPISITRNTPRLGLSNGDTGVWVRHEDPRNDYALFGSQQIPYLLLPPHQLAFASSIHKSQGSEYERVAVVLPSGAEHFCRRLLYTAVTRAKREVRLFGDPAVLEAILSRPTTRHSRIQQKLL